MDIPKTLTKIIRELLSSGHHLSDRTDTMPIIAIYLFGSFAKGAVRKQSDIDLAFVFNEKYYKEDPFRSLQEAELLSIEINRKIIKPIDVIILNSASLSFAYHVIRNGVCLYESTTVDRILYEIAIQNKYEDFMPFINELRDSKRKKLLGRN
jgi:predicted nucleotidyltransferase